MDPENGTLIRRIIGDILRISGAEGLAHILALAASPLIARLYSPEAFGQFAMFNALVTMLTPLTSLRYEWALPLPREEASALDLLALCIVLVAISSLALAIINPFLWPMLAKWIGVSGTEIMLLPVAIFAMGLHAVVTNWLVRERAFREVARVRFTTMVGAVACQIGIGCLFAGPRSLILGMIAGYLLGLALAGYHCRRALWRSAARMDLNGMRGTAAEYRSFALITAPSGAVNALGSQMSSMVLPSLYGLAVNGQYSLARRVLAQPMVLIGQTVNEVLWGNAARLFAEDPARLWPLFLQLNICLLAVMAPSLVLMFFGTEIFAFVFGERWEQAGSFAGIMIAASFLGLAAQGTTSLHIYRLNHWMSLWEVLQLLLIVVALVAAWRMALSPVVCIVGITAAQAASHATLLGLNALAVRRVLRKSEPPQRPTAAARAP